MEQKTFLNMRIVPLAELVPGEDADMFALLSTKDELKTREGKPYFRVAFRDQSREIAFPIWSDSPLAVECRDKWHAGKCYKIRAAYRETNYGPQLDIRRIREATPDDAVDGFDPAKLKPSSRYDAEQMFTDLVHLLRERLVDLPLQDLVIGILMQHKAALLTLPAATRNHHAFAGGWLEHVLSVTKTAWFFAEKYQAYYPEMNPPLNSDLVLAGAVLHDIGKLRELRESPTGAEFTAAGELIGHVLQGRDIVREAAVGTPVNPELLLRLEHIIVSHQRLPEWGSPKPPMTPEALLVHYADDLDAKYHMLYLIYRDDNQPGAMTSARNVLQQKMYRGGE